VVIEGGEYNPYSPSDNETAQGAIYDPVANTWTPIAPPAGVAHIGDASSVVLPNGTFMLGIYNTTADYLLNATTLTWTAAGKTSAEIAEILGLSEHTVNHYLNKATKKLDTVNRTQAVAKALRVGLIE